MKKNWWYFLLLIVLCCLALSAMAITNDDKYIGWLFYAVIASPFLLLINAIRPRRGLHYAFWNRSMMMIFGFVLSGLAGFFGLIYLLGVHISLNESVEKWIVGTYLPIFITSLLLWYRLYYLPSWGDWRIKRYYPNMARTARKLKRFPESYALYMPIIYVEKKAYLVSGYSIDGMTGIATIDANGKFVHDEKLAEILIRCHKLANTVVDFRIAMKWASEIEDMKKTNRQIQDGFKRLRLNEEYFRVAGGEAYELWESIIDFDKIFDNLVKIIYERKMWQVRWAYNHGMYRLVEISDEQLYEVEARLREFDISLHPYLDAVDKAGIDAENLLKMLSSIRSPRKDGVMLLLKNRSRLIELLQSLSAFRDAAELWKVPARDFLISDDEWKWWRARKEIAESMEERGEL